MPLAAVVTDAIEGVAIVDVKPLGPDQLYVPPPVAVKFNVEPTHLGPSLPAVADGVGFTVIFT